MFKKAIPYLIVWGGFWFFYDIEWKLLQYVFAVTIGGVAVGISLKLDENITITRGKINEDQH